MLKKFQKYVIWFSNRYSDAAKCNQKFKPEACIGFIEDISKYNMMMIAMAMKHTWYMSLKYTSFLTKMHYVCVLSEISLHDR